MIASSVWPAGCVENWESSRRRGVVHSACPFSCVHVKRILGRGQALLRAVCPLGLQTAPLATAKETLRCYSDCIFTYFCHGHISAVPHALFPCCSCCRSVHTMCWKKGPEGQQVPDLLLGWIRGTLKQLEPCWAFIADEEERSVCNIKQENINGRLCFVL